MKKILFTIMCVFILLPCGIVIAEERLELNTVLMESTFKLQSTTSSGSAFIIGRPSKKNTNKGYYVLVTAAHVLEKMPGDQAQIILRKKKDDGTYERVPYLIKIREEGKPLWVRHDDEGVDVAAMYVSLPKDVSVPLLPVHFLADDNTFNEFEIHPGDKLMCLGYPLGAEANLSGFPILRSGEIASYPLVPSKQIKTFLYTFPVFKGNSGGPVYFVESNRFYKGAYQMGVTIQFIAGLLIEETLATQKIEELYETKEKRYPLGLATVIHAVFIKETIEKLPEKD